MIRRDGSGLCADPKAHTAPERIPSRGGKSVNGRTSRSQRFIRRPPAVDGAPRARRSAINPPANVLNAFANSWSGRNPRSRPDRASKLSASAPRKPPAATARKTRAGATPEPRRHARSPRRPQGWRRTGPRNRAGSAGIEARERQRRDGLRPKSVPTSVPSVSASAAASAPAKAAAGAPTSRSATATRQFAATCAAPRRPGPSAPRRRRACGVAQARGERADEEEAKQAVGAPAAGGEETAPATPGDRSRGATIPGRPSRARRRRSARPREAAATPRRTAREKARRPDGPSWYHHEGVGIAATRLSSMPARTDSRKAYTAEPISRTRPVGLGGRARRRGRPRWRRDPTAQFASETDPASSRGSRGGRAPPSSSRRSRPPDRRTPSWPRRRRRPAGSARRREDRAASTIAGYATMPASRRARGSR